jgi:hypothetical protein
MFLLNLHEYEFLPAINSEQPNKKPAVQCGKRHIGQRVLYLIHANAAYCGINADLITLRRAKPSYDRSLSSNAYANECSSV